MSDPSEHSISSVSSTSFSPSAASSLTNLAVGFAAGAAVLGAVQLVQKMRTGKNGTGHAA